MLKLPVIREECIWVGETYSSPRHAVSAAHPDSEALCACQSFLLQPFSERRLQRTGDAVLTNGISSWCWSITETGSVTLVLRKDVRICPRENEKDRLPRYFPHRKSV